MAATGPAKTGLSALLRRGWNEIPDIVAGSAVGAVGLILAGLGLVSYYSNDMDNRKYKSLYVVMRPDDPRAAKVHKD